MSSDPDDPKNIPRHSSGNDPVEPVRDNKFRLDSVIQKSR